MMDRQKAVINASEIKTHDKQMTSQFKSKI